MMARDRRRTTCRLKEKIYWTNNRSLLNSRYHSGKAVCQYYHFSRDRLRVFGVITPLLSPFVLAWILSRWRRGLAPFCGLNCTISFMAVRNVFSTISSAEYPAIALWRELSNMVKDAALTTLSCAGVGQRQPIGPPW